MLRTLIIYQSRCDTTAKIVNYISLIMGHLKTCTVDEFVDSYIHYDLFIFGASISKQNQQDDEVLKFITRNINWIQNKKIVLFCYSNEEKQGEKYLQLLKKMLGEKVLYSKVLTSELVIDETVKFALDLREIRYIIKMKAPEEIVRDLLETFLYKNNICTLCTGKEGSVRGTPMEYFYDEGYIYMLTEGGEKYANILLNPNVSICIYNHHGGMDMIQGAQISGIASIIQVNCKEYNEILRSRGLKPDKLLAFPSYLNMLKIKLNKAEYLCYKFIEMGYDRKQNYIFKHNY